MAGTDAATASRSIERALGSGLPILRIDAADGSPVLLAARPRGGIIDDGEFSVRTTASGVFRRYPATRDGVATWVWMRMCSLEADEIGNGLEEVLENLGPDGRTAAVAGIAFQSVRFEGRPARREPSGTSFPAP